MQKPSEPLTQQDLLTLTNLDASARDVRDLIVPPDLSRLSFLGLDGSQLTRFIFPSGLTNLASVGLTGNQLTIRLSPPRRAAAGAFEIAFTGPPVVYAVLASTNLVGWSNIGAATNNLRTILFTDREGSLSPQKFYRARSQ